MWKSVTRRFKDTVERTYNVLDVRQTWTCGVDSKKDIKAPVYSSVVANADTCFAPCEELYIWRRGDSKYNKRRYHGDFNRCYGRHSSFISAFVTTTTLLSGFYLSQAISLAQRRRHLRHTSSFEHQEPQPQITFGQNYCLLHWAKSVYEKSFVPSDKRQNSFVPTDKGHAEFISSGVDLGVFNRPVPVNNDHTKNEEVRVVPF